MLDSSPVTEFEEARPAAADAAPKRLSPGLAARLLLITLGFVLLTQVIFFVPRVAAYRESQLRDRLSAAYTAALVFTAAPDGMLSKELTKQILDSVGAQTIAIKTHNTRRLLAMADAPPPVTDSYDLRDATMMDSIASAFRGFFAPKDAVLKVVGQAPMGGDFLEITLYETRITDIVWAYSGRFLRASLTISAAVALGLWMAIWIFVLRPVRRLTSNIIAFGEKPEDEARIIAPSGSGHEIGKAEEALAAMQRSLGRELEQKKRLAQLGLAVAKINHDLRNMLTAAQLISDRLATIPDPLAIRLGPRLVATLDRAIAFCQETLSYGGAGEKPPTPRDFALNAMLEDVAEVIQARHTHIVDIAIDVPPDLEIRADPDHVLRVVGNLIRNATQALAQHGPGEGKPPAIRISAARRNDEALIEVSDTGPGVPAQLAPRIFEPFHISTRAGGSGLGLAIAAELIDRNGGTIVLAPSRPDDFYSGARFEITLPLARRMAPARAAS
jgi:signal transduction histidine kinase